MSDKIEKFPKPLVKMFYRVGEKYTDPYEEWRVKTAETLEKRIEEINRNYVDAKSRLMAKSDLLIEVLESLKR